MKRLTKAQRVRIAVFGALFAFLLLAYFLLPKMNQVYHWIDQFVSFKTVVILQGLKSWLLSGLLLSAGVLLGLEVIALFLKPSAALPRGARITFRVIAAVMAAAALYWSLGTVFTFGPLPPMSFALWNCIFVTTPAIRYIWWGGLGVSTFLATR